MSAKNNEVGRLFFEFLYPFKDDILKQNRNILSMFIYIYISFSQDISEIGRLFLAFLYPFENDILKQNQNILSMFIYHLGKLEVLPAKNNELADYFQHFYTLLRMTY